MKEGKTFWSCRSRVWMPLVWALVISGSVGVPMWAIVPLRMSMHDEKVGGEDFVVAGDW